MSAAVVLRGRAHVFGDDVDTDQILPARYLVTTDEKELARHCLEVPDPQFVSRVKPGDILVAGKNFGCGSSREHAPIAVQACGVAAVLAVSFARIFFRNAINLGLPIVECPAAAREARPGDEMEIDLNEGRVRNLTRPDAYKAVPFPEEIQRILRAGGLMPYVVQKLQRRAREDR